MNGFASVVCFTANQLPAKKRRAFRTACFETKGAIIESTFGIDRCAVTSEEFPSIGSSRAHWCISVHRWQSSPPGNFSLPNPENALKCAAGRLGIRPKIAPCAIIPAIDGRQVAYRPLECGISRSQVILRTESPPGSHLSSRSPAHRVRQARFASSHFKIRGTL